MNFLFGCGETLLLTLHQSYPKSSIAYLDVEQSLLCGKWLILMPLPKETPFRTCNQLRPISLTNIIMRLYETVVFRSELSNVINNSIGSDQFVYRKGLNTTMALVKCQHEWLRRLDSDADFIRIFSFDISKAFDSVPHDIVCRKLRNLEINPHIHNWIVTQFSKG